MTVFLYLVAIFVTIIMDLVFQVIFSVVYAGKKAGLQGTLVDMWKQFKKRISSHVMCAEMFSEHEKPYGPYDDCALRMLDIYLFCFWFNKTTV